MAVVTVGGAYAVLAYVAQEAVENYRWLSPDQMLVGPRPRRDHAGAADPGAAIRGLPRGLRGGRARPGGVLASLLTVWVTFAPCFAFIFLGAPFVERLHANRKLTGALAAVTAAVVGVIANLALWFGLRVLFAEVRQVELGPVRLDLPAPGSLDPLALALAALAAACLFGLKLGLLRTLGVTAAAGAAAKLALG